MPYSQDQINHMARSRDPETRERAVDLYIEHKKEQEIEARIAAEIKNRKGRSDAENLLHRETI